jgi:cell division protein FtsB
MKPAIAPIVVAFSLAATGCIGDRTRNMAEACQGLLEQEGARSNARTFIQDAEKQLAYLGRPTNKLAAYVRDLQDPEAMTHKAALEQCLWLLKSREV